MDSGAATMSGAANFMEELLSYMESRQGVTRDTKAKKRAGSDTMSGQTVTP